MKSRFAIYSVILPFGAHFLNTLKLYTILIALGMLRVAAREVAGGLALWWTGRVPVVI